MKRRWPSRQPARPLRRKQCSLRAAIILLAVSAVGCCAWLSKKSNTAPSTVATAAPRRTSAACNYAGVVLADGRCECGAPWTGANCSFLDALPTLPEGAGGFSQRASSSSIWGASPIRDDDGLYHVFASKMALECPVFGADNQQYWLTNSYVVRGEASRPEGPYEEKEVVLGDRGPARWDGRQQHNPTIRRAADGTYLLFYTGTTFEGPRPSCVGGARPSLADARPLAERARSRQQIGVAVAPHPRGPWTRPDWPSLRTADAAPDGFDGRFNTNPSPLVLGNDSVLLVYKGVRRAKPFRMRFGVAFAPHYASPAYARLATGRPLFSDLCGGAGCDIEDAFAWRDGAVFHMLFKDQTGAFAGEVDGGARATSRDALAWALAGKAYSRSTRLGGRAVDLTFRERSQLLFDASGRPTHLFNAVLEGAKGEHTWNAVTPLRA